jgi:hypothetical protein
MLSFKDPQMDVGIDATENVKSEEVTSLMLMCSLRQGDPSFVCECLDAVTAMQPSLWFFRLKPFQLLSSVQCALPNSHSRCATARSALPLRDVNLRAARVALPDFCALKSCSPSFALSQTFALSLGSRSRIHVSFISGYGNPVSIPLHRSYFQLLRFQTVRADRRYINRDCKRPVQQCRERSHKTLRPVEGKC